MKKMVGCAVLSAAMAASVSLAAEMPSPAFRVPKMSKAPVIDGVVDEAEWAETVGSFGFCTYPTDTMFQMKSRFWIGRTADRLYVASVCAIGPNGLLKETPRRNRSQKCLLDDTFELVFIPDMTAATPDVRHAMVNFNGAYFVEAQINGAMAAWNLRTMETRSTERDGFWHFELSISLDEIGFLDAPADAHALRLCRNWKGAYSTWGVVSSMRPNDSGFFSAHKAIPLVFDDDAPAVQFIDVESGDEVHWTTELRVANTSSRDQSFKVRVEGRPVNSQPGMTVEDVALKAGERRTFKVSGPILNDEKVDLAAEVLPADGTRPHFFRRTVWRPNAPKPEWIGSGASASAVKFDFAYFPSHSKMRVRADLSAVAKRPADVSVTVRDAKDAVLATRRFALAKDGIADEIWAIPDLKEATLRSGDGGYTVTLEAAGVENGTVKKAFRRDVFAWEGFAGGTSATIPAPFTAVERKDGHVRVVLRDHEVDELGLWRQVTAAGKPVLARPMRLVGDGAVSAVSEWDIDGMMKWTLTLGAGRHTSLRLEVPIRAERATLMHACADGMRYNYAGEVPKGRGRVWRSSQAPHTSIIGNYLPYVWIGGPLRGIAVYGENDRGWEIAPDAECYEIVREDDGTVTLVANIVQKPVELAAPRTVTLAFQATPIKPMERNWRGSDIGDLVGSCYYWGGLTAYDEVQPFNGTDEFWRKMGEARKTGKADKAYVERMIADYMALIPTNNAAQREARRRTIVAHFNSGMNVSAGTFGTGKKLVFYTNGRGVRLGSPAGSTFCDEWTVEPFWKRPFTFDTTRSYSLDPNRAYLDYAAYWWERMIASGACDYLYWDDIFCQSNFDLVGTDAYRLPDGDIQPASGIFRMREQIRRCAVLQAEHGWPCQKNWVHMTNTALAPVLAFAGMNYDWEDVAGDTALQERYSRAGIQAASIGRQFGNQVAVMGYFSTKDPASEKLKWLHRTGVGACLTHEVQWRRVAEWRTADKLLGDWGYRAEGTAVWNYWDEDVPFPVAVSGGENAALAMARNGEAVVVVSDWEKGGNYRLKPDAGALGLPAGFRAFDMETGKELAVTDGAVSVALKRLDYVIVRFAK